MVQMKTERFRRTIWLFQFNQPCYATSFDIVLNTGEKDLMSPPGFTMYYVQRCFQTPEVGKQIFFRKSQIHKSLGSFRYHKSANILGVPVRKLEIRKDLWLIRKLQISSFLKKNTTQLYLKTVLKVFFSTLYMLLADLSGHKVCICGQAEVSSQPI